MRFKKSLLLILLLTCSIASAANLRLATTTSTANSGLLEHILPEFEKHSGYKVHVIAVGTGKALRMGEDGDVDVLLVHARQAEDSFIAAGHGVLRKDVMYNDFVLVGPVSDPAAIRGKSDISQALASIATAHSIFISRGDQSGTHKKELALWKQSGGSHSGMWYREAGQGMGKVLQISNELDAYTLVDRGTWLAYADKVELQIMLQGDKRLFNPYGVIAINPQRHKDIDHKGAMAFVNWITATATQKKISEFRIHGKSLFIPNATQ
ncbi:MAG: substrate-binding domain-containing protein [Gammaproteobacteria bacterium]|nr:substrate-binding domain-containing protein [Gammaproteobacteria bacterium]